MFKGKIAKANLVTLVFLGVSTLTYAGGATGVGGGGNERIRNFVQVASEAIRAIELKSGTKYSVTLLNSLQQVAASGGIVLVDNLKDRSGIPLHDSNLYAYSWPGEIQLLQDPWTDWLKDLSTAEHYRADIVHEVFRTVDPKMDDGYSISILQLGLAGSGINQPYPCDLT